MYIYKTLISVFETDFEVKKRLKYIYKIHTYWMNRSEDARRCESSNQDEKLSHYEVII